MNPIVIMVMLQREQQNIDVSRISCCVQTFILGNKTSFDLVKDSDLNPFVASLDLVVPVSKIAYTETDESRY